MSPAEHYAEAERLLNLADRTVSANWPIETGEWKSDVLAAAQVHATLALATHQTPGHPDLLGGERAAGSSPPD